MTTDHPRMQRELLTIEHMIQLYCHDHHTVGAETLCSSCQVLLDYARLRLNKCPFQENKTTCGHCAIHCYKPTMREQIRGVMRYSGPRMLRKHPLLALYHVLDGLRKKSGTG